MLSVLVCSFSFCKKESVHPLPPYCYVLSSSLPLCLQEHFVWSCGALVVPKPGKNSERLVHHPWKDGEGQEQGLDSAVAQCSAWRSGTSSKAGTHHTDVGAVQERVTKSTPGRDSNRAPLGFRAQVHFWCLSAYICTEGEGACRLYFARAAQKRYSEYFLLVVWFDTWHSNLPGHRMWSHSVSDIIKDVWLKYQL